MKKSIYNQNVSDQECDDMEGEENRNNAGTSGLLYNEADRCPICLSCLLGKEVGFPESCNHVFCLTCILKWSEILASCPIDRKPFQAVFELSVFEDCGKIQVKRQLREIKDKENERFLKKQLSYHESSKSDKRKGNSIREDLLCERFHYLQVSHRNCSDNKIGEKKNTTVKTNKVQRSNQCRDPCMGNFVLSLFSCGSHSVGPRAYRASCTESVDVNEMSSLIRQKRQEMELSWFSNTLPGSGRVDFVPWSVEAEVIPLITSVLPRTIFPASTMSLDTFGTYHKGYALAHTQGGGEKKQTSGTSNTRGSRRKPATTVPTRRSTRNTRAETVSQPQKSPVSNNSECDAPGNSNSSVSISPPAESEKQTRQAPKRKSVRRGRKQPSLKKKLRKSVPAPEKTTSSDSVEEETLADSDTPPMLEKEQQSGIESSSISSVQTDGENHLVNCLKSCSEQTEENEQTKKHVLDEEVEFLYSEPYTQDPPMLVGEDTGIETKELGVEHEVSTDTSVKGSDPLGNEEQTSGSTESEVQALVCAESPPDDFLPCPASDIEGPQPVSSPLGERSENIGSVINDETIEEDLTVESTDGKDSPVNIEAFEESLKLESCEGEITHTLDRHCVASLVTELPEHVQTVNTEIMPTHDTSDNENSGAIQDCEDNLLKHNLDNTQLDKSSEEKKESLSEHPLPIEFSDTQTEQSEKHFSEDNNETVPMECDSFCSDQNESEMESSVNTDSKQSSENSVTHSSENKLSFDHPAVEKVETVAQPAESLLDKAPKPRTRRSRFHSPSTTWSPNKDTAQEKRRAQSPSPKRETALESKDSQSPSPKRESARGRRKSRSLSPKKDVAREGRPFRSPKREDAKEAKRSESISPRRDAPRENQRSQSRVKDSSSREQSRSRSRERESERDGQRRDRDRERRVRRWSRSRSRSRSPSRLRTKSKSSSFGRNERDSYSPRWKERWTNDGWRCPRGNDRYRRNDSEKQNENTRKEKNDISDTNDPNSTDKHRNDCPTWVTEKINSGPDPRTRNPEKLKDSHWEENRNENSGNSWSKNFGGSGWISNRGRGGRGKGTYRGNFAYTEQSENRWQSRTPLSGSDSFKSVEQQPSKRKSEQDLSFGTPADRSGWTSASSWAVRKTLPADVQNYYSRRGRNSSGPQSGWMRQEEEAPEQDCNLKDQTNQVDGSQLPVNMMQQHMNVIQPPMNPQHQPMSIFPYPVGVHAPLMNMQRNPFTMHPQLPMHLHTGVPLMQVAAPASVPQGLPPPPPPPPSQQVSYIASQPDGKQVQGLPSACHVSNNMTTQVLPAPAAAPGNTGSVQGPSSGNTSSSSHVQASNAAVKLAESKVSVPVEASADSSKTDKKLQIQEKAAQEVKLAIKPFYQNKDITKEEYKEIVRKAVDKVCHSKSGEVNSTKVANLVKAYVDKYKYSRKGSQKKALEEPVSTEKNIG
ncbi:protein SCAF11 isoform X1 [Cricetulus griseus]|uniref:Protein SCAF11 isoform X1 n=1 Tax=Cricetulus griseus TaxID=10029 RepID=G3I804_CRIGR|nr:protein SCAF11 isoform X1 [Cricetulus griseus]XP_007649921.1 protein SCAF11 isoform X1 [Cricetulus griseus]XP_027252185.1 protein SCAF11 isoform X1 [Cricetulus griseus]XP_027252186.1 protein SCAF11 isoform X1 [Cricetulus griseus]EGW01259.1 SFRS2-interacting protein [Cricetulus griseus]